MIRSLASLATTLGLALTTATVALAQAAPNDRALILAEPDFTLVALPTSLRVPNHRGVFRVTHRFTEALDDASASDLFGIDSGARIGLEFRFGLVPNGDIGIHRTNDKTIEFFGKYGLTRQNQHMPLEIAAFASIDGTNNFGASGSTPGKFAPAVGLVVTRLVGERAALYVEPIWVHHANIFEPSTNAHADTFMTGLAVRVRVQPSVYVVGEYIPRLAGYTAHRDQASFAIEKRYGGHVFQLNVSDAVGTTMGQLARGDLGIAGWHLGFNISRKFF